MHPFITLGAIKIPVYGLCIVAGILFGGYFASRLCKLRNKDFLDFIIPSVLMISFGFVTAKILYLLVTFPPKYFFKIVIKMLFGRDNSLLSSGFVFLGGIPGAVAGYFLGVKIAKCDWKEYLDVYGVVIPFAHGFGRLGCFFAGCCYGALMPHSLIHYPVQLLESFFVFEISMILRWRYVKGKTGLLYEYLLLYSPVRFIIEFFRGDAARGFIGILSVSQWICIFLFIAVIVIKTAPLMRKK